VRVRGFVQQDFDVAQVMVGLVERLVAHAARAHTARSHQGPATPVDRVRMAQRTTQIDRRREQRAEHDTRRRHVRSRSRRVNMHRSETVTISIKDRRFTFRRRVQHVRDMREKAPTRPRASVRRGPVISPVPKIT
jgi:hypothetical protein